MVALEVKADLDRIARARDTLLRIGKELSQIERMPAINNRRVRSRAEDRLDSVFDRFVDVQHALSTVELYRDPTGRLLMRQEWVEPRLLPLFGDLRLQALRLQRDHERVLFVQLQRQRDAIAREARRIGLIATTPEEPHTAGLIAHAAAIAARDGLADRTRVLVLVGPSDHVHTATGDRSPPTRQPGLGRPLVAAA